MSRVADREAAYTRALQEFAGNSDLTKDLLKELREEFARRYAAELHLQIDQFMQVIATRGRPGVLARPGGHHGAAMLSVHVKPFDLCIQI